MQNNPCKDCERRTVRCHADCADYAALQADNAVRRAYREAHKATVADELLAAGRYKCHRKALKRR